MPARAASRGLRHDAAVIRGKEVGFRVVARMALEGLMKKPGASRLSQREDDLGAESPHSMCDPGRFNPMPRDSWLEQTLG